MFCVACMIYAFDVAGTFAIAVLFMSKEKKMQKLTCKDVCVLTRFDVSNMDCICFV